MSDITHISDEEGGADLTPQQQARQNFLTEAGKERPCVVRSADVGDSFIQVEYAYDYGTDRAEPSLSVSNGGDRLNSTLEFPAGASAEQAWAMFEKAQDFATQHADPDVVYMMMRKEMRNLRTEIQEADEAERARELSEYKAGIYKDASLDEVVEGRRVTMKWVPRDKVREGGYYEVEFPGLPPDRGVVQSGDQPFNTFRFFPSPSDTATSKERVELFTRYVKQRFALQAKYGDEGDEGVLQELMYLRRQGGVEHTYADWGKFNDLNIAVNDLAFSLMGGDGFRVYVATDDERERRVNAEEVQIIFNGDFRLAGEVFEAVKGYATLAQGTPQEKADTVRRQVKSFIKERQPHPSMDDEEEEEDDWSWGDS